MSSVAETNLAVNNDDDLAFFGETIVAKASGTGSNTNVRAIVQRETRASSMDEAPANMYNTMVVQASATDWPTPQEFHKSNNPGADTFLIDGAVWFLKRKLTANPIAGLWELELQDRGQD